MEGKTSPEVARWLTALERAGERRAVLADLMGLFGELLHCLYGVAPPETPAPARSDEELRALAEGGFPLLRPEEDVPVEGRWCRDRAQGLLDLLRRRSPDDEELRRVAEAVAAASFDLDLLWPLALARDGEAITALARREALPVGLLHLLAGACVRPLVESRALQVGPALRLDRWREPYCPACGDGPAVGEIDKKGSRHLLCASCNTSWPSYRMQCPFCGTRDHEQLHYFTVEDDPGARIDCCKACKSYLKTFDRREGAVAKELWMADLTTVHLDLVGQREGYRRPVPSLVGLVLAAVGVGPVPEPWTPPPRVSPLEGEAGPMNLRGDASH
ncbi:MAG: formate dehydrogenase accessory protein FdhE [bacterium]|nr:formate dehydrogenase accessory protein FdhE [bacterium]